MKNWPVPLSLTLFKSQCKFTQLWVELTLGDNGVARSTEGATRHPLLSLHAPLPHVSRKKKRMYLLYIHLPQRWLSRVGTGRCVQCEVEQVSRSRPRWCMGRRWALCRLFRNPMGEVWEMLPGPAVNGTHRHKATMKLWWGGSCGCAVGGMMTRPISNTWRKERFRVTCWPQVCAPEGDDGGREYSGLLASGTSPVDLGMGRTWESYYPQPSSSPEVGGNPNSQPCRERAVEGAWGVSLLSPNSLCNPSPPH